MPPRSQHRFVPQPFTRLVRVHALMAAGEASMAVALADSLFLSITPGEARSRVLLFLGISFAPFVVLARFIGPVIDRIPGGRRLLVALIGAIRAVVMLVMVSQLDSLLLFPLAFLMVLVNISCWPFCPGLAFTIKPCPTLMNWVGVKEVPPVPVPGPVDVPGTPPVPL